MLLLALLVCCSLGALRATPYGRYDASCVHKVPSGSHIQTVNGTVHVLHHSFPGGHRALPKCRSQHRANSKAANKFGSGGGAKGKAARQFAPDYDGWLAYTSYQTALPTFDNFLGSFSVPDIPASTPEVLYIFTGLQNTDWVPKVDPEPRVFDIIQPVLQVPADSGSGYSLKSWYVTLDSGVIETAEVPCLPGDVVFGNMTYLKKSFLGGKWFVGGTVKRTGQTASLTADKARLKTQPWAYTTVECYGCNGGCSYLPTVPLVFSGLSGAYDGKNIPFQWKAFVTPNPVCSTGPVAHITGSSTVVYSW
jgi:hypothetical protein